ncbi:MAG: D-alanyl-D-alanine carboxypeptidase DacB [Chlamydiia bacterium]|nr:D-alanyl-D-alanine carboxypeptidase DacB [Chlamydiia bacterium]MCH9618431.1 D-alanyl-D-alanine carboxypeptidase DacB [Chlamydiia bacterium]MCH9623757.1 D-alanyl-D-alanine carboxypeptidase DacB [Chlamydiia bacterium]
MDKRIYPASVTKIATALYILEECDVDRSLLVTCNADALQVVTEKKKVASKFSLAPYLLENDGVTLHLHKGERLTLEDLLYALMVKSANDAANVLASLYAPSIPDFMFQVNKYLRSIGCKNTHFVNPHGLHHPDHYTTAHDLAIMLQRASVHPFLRKLMSTQHYEIKKTGHSPCRAISCYNKLIHPTSKYYMPSVIGGKTGYHHRAKRNIAAFGKKNDRSIIAVINKAEKPEVLFDDCRKLFTAAFEETLAQRMLFNAQESKFTHKLHWANKELTASLKEDLFLTYYPSEEENIDVKIHWAEITSPVQAGDIVGTLDVYNQDNAPIMQQNLYADRAVGYKFTYLIELFFNNLIKAIATYPKTMLVLFLGILFFIRSRRHRISSAK